MLIQANTIRQSKSWGACLGRSSTIGWCMVALLVTLAGAAHANQQSSESAAPVRLFGQTLFIVRTGLADVTPEARAAAIEKRLRRLVESNPTLLSNLAIEDHEETSYVLTREEVLFVVTEQEARVAGIPRRTLAQEWAEQIQRTVQAMVPPTTENQSQLSVQVRDLLWAGVATAFLFFLAVAARIGFPLLYEFLHAWRGTRIRPLSIGGVELISADHLVDVLLYFSRFLRIVLSVGALYFYFHVILNLFPQTREFEDRFFVSLAIPFESIRAVHANWTSLLAGVFLTAVATGLFLAILRLFRSLFPQLIERVSQWGRVTTYCLKIQQVELLSGTQIAEGAVGTLRILRVVAYTSVTYLYVTSILGFFPATQQLSIELLGYLIEPLKLIGMTFVSSLPDFIAIAIIVLVTKYIIKLIHLFFTGIERGAITFQGFHREWAAPTYKIVRFFALVFAAVAIVPYIPGSHSEAFKGISVFLGVLVSLGAAGSFSNIVAGIVLTYMRPFSVGDRVKIAETTGDITQKTLLVTRIRTNKNVDVTIPNSLVLSSHIINFSSSATNPPPLILHTSVTIGYDVPWRKVHELLLAAAKRTTGILDTPEPFVLQTSLNDFYVTYEINGYTKHPNQMASTYAELHQHIQDLFNEAGVEIMSPHYLQIRDGNKTTIPDDYLPKDYQAPGIRIWPLRSLHPRSESTSPDGTAK
ncbi:MAG: mechanosensitive ion channel family protein [Nitrospira sp.]|nr:mechanosensitive ion channel family protein [Nitrospira sp.]